MLGKRLLTCVSDVRIGSALEERLDHLRVITLGSVKQWSSPQQLWVCAVDMVGVGAFLHGLQVFGKFRPLLVSRDAEKGGG